MTEYIRISNHDILHNIKQVAIDKIAQIEAKWDSDVAEAQTAYNKLSPFAKFFDRYVLGFFIPGKGKYYKLLYAQECHGVAYLIQYERCADISIKIGFAAATSTSMDFTESDISNLKLDYMWAKYTKLKKR